MTKTAMPEHVGGAGEAGRRAVEILIIPCTKSKRPQTNRICALP